MTNSQINDALTESLKSVFTKNSQNLLQLYEDFALASHVDILSEQHTVKKSFLDFLYGIVSLSSLTTLETLHEMGVLVLDEDNPQERP